MKLPTLEHLTFQSELSYSFLDENPLLPPSCDWLHGSPQQKSHIVCSFHPFPHSIFLSEPMIAHHFRKSSHFSLPECTLSLSLSIWTPCLWCWRNSLTSFLYSCSWSIICKQYFLNGLKALAIVSWKLNCIAIFFRFCACGQNHSQLHTSFSNH